MTTAFRYLVSISATLYVVFWIFPYLDYKWLNEDELTILSANYYGSIIPLNDFVDWGLFVAWIILYIGLWFYIRAARIAFLIFAAITSVANFFWGFSVMTSYEFAIQNVLAMAEGAMLVMAYFTSVRSEFENG